MDIFGLLSSEFLKLIALSHFIAWPIGYVMTRHWLDSFAYRIDLRLDAFAISGFLCVILAMATVFYQTMKVARINPIEALRQE